MKKILLLLVLILSACQPVAQRALAVQSITISGDYDCHGATVDHIDVINKHDITVRNCNVVVTFDTQAVKVRDSYNVVFDNVNISSNYPESGYDLESTNVGCPTHDILIQNSHIYGNMGWGISGSENPLCNITVKNVLIEDIGKAGGAEKHGMYINNWQGFLVEDVTVLRSWNAGIKIVSNTFDGTFNRVTIKDSGRGSDTSGPGVSLGDARADSIHNLTFSYCDIQNSKSPAIWNTEAGVNNVTIDHCFFKNNRHAVEIFTGDRGWIVTNNVGYNQVSYSFGVVPLKIGSTGDVANNFFDFNNWYRDGQPPIRIGSSAFYTLVQWQALAGHPDQHSISQLPGNATGTPAPTGTFTPTLTRTLTASPTVTRTVNTPTFTATPQIATTTPTVSSTVRPTLTNTPTATRTPTPTFTVTPTATITQTPSPTITATPTQSALCIKSVWTKQLKERPAASMYNVTFGVSIDPNAIIYIEAIVTNGEGKWGQVNYHTYAAMWLIPDKDHPNGRTFAVETGCP